MLFGTPFSFQNGQKKPRFRGLTEQERFVDAVVATQGVRYLLGGGASRLIIVHAHADIPEWG